MPGVAPCRVSTIVATAITPATTSSTVRSRCRSVPRSITATPSATKQSAVFTLRDDEPKPSSVSRRRSSAHPTSAIAPSATTTPPRSRPTILATLDSSAEAGGGMSAGSPRRSSASFVRGRSHRIGAPEGVLRRPLFDGVSFRLRRGDRLALAGPNGAGKTTLLRTIVGETSLTAGELAFAKDTRVALHDQRPPRGKGLTLREYSLSGAGDLVGIEDELRRLEEAMAAGDHDACDAPPLQRRAGEARARGRVGLARSSRLDRARPRVHRRRPRPPARHVLGRGADPGVARPRAVGGSRPPPARRADEPPRRREPRVARARAHLARRRDRPRRTRPLVPRGGDDGGSRAAAGRSRSSSTARGTPGDGRRRRARRPRRRSSTGSATTSSASSGSSNGSGTRSRRRSRRRRS